MPTENIYGFDFLKEEHIFSSVSKKYINAQSWKIDSNQSSKEKSVLQSIGNKSVLEKQFDVIQFLYAHRSSGCIPPSFIFNAIGIDLSDGGKDESVTKMIMRNPKIRVEEIPDPENPSLTIFSFGYQAKFNNIRNKDDIIALINRCRNGVKRSDLIDAYDGVETDLDYLQMAGDILVVPNNEEKSLILFPRGEIFLVKLEGNVNLSPHVVDALKEEDDIKSKSQNVLKVDEAKMLPLVKTILNKDFVHGRYSNVISLPRSIVSPRKWKCFNIEVDIDPREQVRRGEAVWIAGQWFRVSSAVKDGPLSDQPSRAQAPTSVSSRKDMSKKNEQDGYIRPLTDRILPLDHALSVETMKNIMESKGAKDTLCRLSRGRYGTIRGFYSQNNRTHLSSMDGNFLSEQFSESLSSSIISSVHHQRRPALVKSSSISTIHLNNEANVNISSSTVTNMVDHITHVKKAASNPALVYCHVRRHGCTIDVKNMYMETIDNVPESEEELFRLMVEYKLLDDNEQFKKPLLKVKNKNHDEDGKPKKRRYYERRGQRFTNTHLIGTTVGIALMKAQEKLYQSKMIVDV